MTRGLEDLLNLPESSEIISKDLNSKKKSEYKDSKEYLKEIAEIEKLSENLPVSKGIGKLLDSELNEVSEKSMKAYEDLMSLGMNVELKYSGKMFAVASELLKINLSAKIAKMDKKIKMIELALAAQKLATKNAAQPVVVNKPSEEEEEVKEVKEVIETVVTDRNSLIEQLSKMNKDK